MAEIKLGDAVTRIAKVLGIPHCEKCEERRVILNEIQRLGFKETARRMMAVSRNATEKESRAAVEEVVKQLTDCCKE